MALMSIEQRQTKTAERRPKRQQHNIVNENSSVRAAENIIIRAASRQSAGGNSNKNSQKISFNNKNFQQFTTIDLTTKKDSSVGQTKASTVPNSIDKNFEQRMKQIDLLANGNDMVSVEFCQKFKFSETEKC